MKTLGMMLDLESDEHLEDNSNQSALIKQSVTMLYRLAQTHYILINHGTTRCWSNNKKILAIVPCALRE